MTFDNIFIFLFYLFSTRVWAISLYSFYICVCEWVCLCMCLWVLCSFISDGPIKWQFDIEWSNKLLFFFLISIFLCHHQQFIFLKFIILFYIFIFILVYVFSLHRRRLCLVIARKISNVQRPNTHTHTQKSVFNSFSSDIFYFIIYSTIWLESCWSCCCKKKR